MAVYTKDGQLTYVDDQGNEYQLFPKTKLANVEGLEDALKGKAPDGFGLGSAMSPVATNLNTTVKNGWFSYGDSTTGRPAYIPYGVVLVSTRSGEVIQKAFGTTDANYSHMINAQRRSPNGGSSWTDWEYENPPMMNGVEYRTTDRHEGKAIYKKLNSGIEWYRVEGSDTWKQQNELMGAAPAGYGLGSELGKACSDCDLALENGYYQIGASTAHRPDGMSTRCWMQVISYGSTYKTQICYSSSNAMQIREMNNGTWSEWEWVNPPMVLGKLYRTTERWNGKVVYTKMVSVGNLPNTSTKSVEGVVTNGFTNLVDLKYYIYAGYTHRNYDSRVSMAVKTENQYAWIDITTTENLSGYAGFVTLKYTID
jgi:hypothetical protein